jgi:hypothetical protein
MAKPVSGTNALLRNVNSLSGNPRKVLGSD